MLVMVKEHPLAWENKIGGKRVGRNRRGVTTKEFVRTRRDNAPRSAGGRSNEIIVKVLGKGQKKIWGGAG